MRSYKYFSDRHLSTLGCVWSAKKQGIGQDKSGYTVFDCETVSGTGQIGWQGTTQKQKFLSSTKPHHNFLSIVQVV
jgi:hypothetical protein